MPLDYVIAGRFTEPLLKSLGIYGDFAIVVSGDSLPKKKPDPLPLLHAAEVLGVAPEDALMIGDSVNDVEAARAAGFSRRSAIPCRRFRRERIPALHSVRGSERSPNGVKRNPGMDYIERNRIDPHYLCRLWGSSLPFASSAIVVTNREHVPFSHLLASSLSRCGEHARLCPCAVFACERRHVVGSGG
jgi:hypothetical protein